MNKEKIAGFCAAVYYWLIILIPFSVIFGLGLANVCIVITAAAFIIKKFLKKERIFINVPVCMAYACVVIGTILSFKNTLFIDNSVKGLVRWLIEYPLIFLVVADGIKDAKHVRYVVLSIGVSIAIVSIDAVWQMIFGKDFIWGNLIQSSPIGLARPTASFNGTNLLGIFLAMLTPFVAALALFYYHGRSRLWIAAAVFLGITGVFLTLSRSAGLGVWLAILFFGIMKRKKLLIAVLLSLLLIYPFIMPKNIRDWAHKIKYNPVVFLFNYDRLSMYRNALNMIKTHPVVGVGVNTFSNNYAKYRLPETEEGRTADTTYAHNIYLHMAGEIGLLGLAAFIWFLYALFKQGIEAYRNSKDEYLKIAALGLMGSFIAFLINGMTETNLYFPTLVVTFWYLVGLSLSLKRL